MDTNDWLKAEELFSKASLEFKQALLDHVEDNWCEWMVKLASTEPNDGSTESWEKAGLQRAMGPDVVQAAKIAVSLSQSMGLLDTSSTETGSILWTGGGWTVRSTKSGMSHADACQYVRRFHGAKWGGFSDAGDNRVRLLTQGLEKWFEEEKENLKKIDVLDRWNCGYKGVERASLIMDENFDQDGFRDTEGGIAVTDYALARLGRLGSTEKPERSLESEYNQYNEEYLGHESHPSLRRNK